MMFTKNNIISLFLLSITFCLLEKSYGQDFVTSNSTKNSLNIAGNNILMDSHENITIKKTADLFRQDLQKLSNKKVDIISSIANSNSVIVIGSLDNNSIFIQDLLKRKKIIVDSLRNVWEGYQWQVVDQPFKGIKKALVIIGSDKRGTAYGMLDLSRQMGVSPWNWWADVPIVSKKEIRVRTDTIITQIPKVQYRGIFLNDEEPALGGWAREKFGGFNHHFYAKVFELMLRLKANYLWPAMWGKSFFSDDTINFQTADTFGIVIGTSHHEPLMRAQEDWHKTYSGKWDYTVNKDVLNKFWTKGMQFAKPYDKLVTIGMRGDGDEPMTEGTAIHLLENIIKDQREIITKVTDLPAEKTPQIWALYKEVQDYYDKGMRVPDDITLLLCDDNWGNIRRLPHPDEKQRIGGYGIYYHFDYVGGPRNYKWINTNNISRVWEQMNLAYQYGVKKVWIVNVGDLKPMEYPISFFLDYAWNPDKIQAKDLHSYAVNWSEEQFGKKYAQKIASLIERYTQYNAIRKPELLDEKVLSLDNYQEFERLTATYIALEKEASKLNNELPSVSKDAYFQLVLHPIKAMANLYQLYFYTALNHRAYKEKNILANNYADSAYKYYKEDSLLTIQYHHINHGKWNHFMSQTHIGYDNWQQPNTNKMPIIYHIENGEKSPSAVVSKIPTLLQTKKRETLSIEQDKRGWISISSENYNKILSSPYSTWLAIPHIAREGNGITKLPVTKFDTTHIELAPQLQYVFETSKTGNITIYTYLSPTLNYLQLKNGFQFSIAIDDEQPQTIFVNKNENKFGVWDGWVSNNINIQKSQHLLKKSSKHILKIYTTHPGIVFQKFVLDLGGLKPSYLGPITTD